MTRYILLLGFPLKHSISPLFQQKALDFYNLDVRYQAWEIKSEDLEKTVKLLQQPEYIGANITIPYKEAVIPFLDSLSSEAQYIGAVNTIVKEEGGLKGYNTDAFGFLQSLREAGFSPKGKRAVILGAGGGAKAVSYALIEAEASSIIIFNRTYLRGEELVQRFRQLSKKGQDLKAFPLEEQKIKETLTSCHLLINATPFGMKYSSYEGKMLFEAKFIPEDALVYDLVYNPLETPLIKKARERGAKTLSGLGMLVHQGAFSFELWTGRKAPVEMMFEVARKALEGK